MESTPAPFRSIDANEDGDEDEEEGAGNRKDDEDEEEGASGEESTGGNGSMSSVPGVVTATFPSSRSAIVSAFPSRSCLVDMQFTIFGSTLPQR